MSFKGVLLIYYDGYKAYDLLILLRLSYAVRICLCLPTFFYLKRKNKNEKLRTFVKAYP